MTGGFLHLAMLGGLAAVAVPVVIHLLARRDEPVVPWAAMQFLELAPRQQRKVRFADALLMLARMLPLALAALALARPYWRPAGATEGTSEITGSTGRRDVVLVLDGSASLADANHPNDSPRSRAIAWARRYLATLRAGDTVAVLMAGDSLVPVVVPPRADLAAVSRALDNLPAPRDAGDLAGAVAEAFRLLGDPGLVNPSREVIVLSDGHRGGWRSEDAARWGLLRAIPAGMNPRPAVRVVLFPHAATGIESGPDGSVATVELTPAIAPSGQTVEVVATVGNAGPGPLTRGVELVVDSEPVANSAQVIGPVPPGGRTPARFSTTLSGRGDHLVSVRLADAADPHPGNDQSAQLARVVAPPRILLVEDRSQRVESSPTRFLHVALAPVGGSATRFDVVEVTPGTIQPGTISGASVIVVTGDRPPLPDQVRALVAWAERGGSLVLIPSPSADAETWARPFGRDALPATFGPMLGDLARRQIVARVDPKSLAGSTLARLGGEDAAINSAAWFAYRKLSPTPGTTIVARFDAGDPWIIERSRGRGRVSLVAAGFDAEAGTIVANPDFVPLVHQWFGSLAGQPAAPTSVPPGASLRFTLDPDPDRDTLNLTTPSGKVISVPVTRNESGTFATLAAATETGIYRLDAPDRPRFAIVASDPILADPTPLSQADRDRLTKTGGLQIAAESDPIAGPDGTSSTRSTRREVAPLLLLAVLAGLCLEIALTRRMAQGRGPIPAIFR